LASGTALALGSASLFADATRDAFGRARGGLAQQMLELDENLSIGSGSTSERTLQSRQLMSPVGGTTRTSIRRWSMSEV